jgi:hypothetical protein
MATTQGPAAAGPQHHLLVAPPTSTAFDEFSFWIVGDTPLIVHAWSMKAKKEMLDKQLKKTRAGKDAREPEKDFVDSLYDMGNGHFGFPATGVKNCLVASAHKSKGIAKTEALAAIFLNAEMIRVGPALAGAICDMPLVRVHAERPEMREDMVKIGTGLNKVASLAYRGQFRWWGMRITGQLNTAVCTVQQLIFLVRESGLACGLGEWRNERKGMFGAFHLATAEEVAAWDAYADGAGDLPRPALAIAAE